MNFSELVGQTRTIHSFIPNEGPSKQELESCLELCLLAPNHKMTFPWKIIRASGELRQKIADVTADYKARSGGNEQECEVSRQRSLSAKELVIFVHKKNPEDTFREREDYATLCCSIQLLALSLRDLGYGYKWSTGKVSRAPEVSGLLGVKDLEEVIGFVWVGKEGKALGVAKRPLLKEVLEEI